MLRQKWSRGQVEARLADVPPCRIEEACVVGAYLIWLGAHSPSKNPFKLALMASLALLLIAIVRLVPELLDLIRRSRPCCVTASRCLPASRNSFNQE